MKRQNYKHGKYVMAEPNPHVDIQKYETKDGKDDGKRYKVPDSEMKVSKKNRKQNPQSPGSKAAKKKLSLIDSFKKKPVLIMTNEGEAKMSFKKGGSVKKKKSSAGKAIRGKGCEIR